MDKGIRRIHEILLLLVLLFVSCTDDDTLTELNEGSPRDWTYIGDNVKVYVEGKICESVTEITVKSLQLTDGEEADTNPRYETTLIIKGLEKKNKSKEIKVESTIDTFQGKTVYNGSNYVVSGEYVGNPFTTHYSQLGIIVNLYMK